ncbi:hypothetical protein KV134_07655 [Tetragenococcus halophilus]|nr:hypothetical protein [Tetragenococcus halophilus]QXN86113.1 hypothetical protein KV134_07655 [Tetragenococcus halophilus]RQD32494.1 hypothetical protein C7K42_00580 [Tetragenococcus halophilus subsp. halophilus DSM 20339]GBD60016.1 putative uncharacterized protein [Tetragenococcus halophilus subsp. halophilus]GBD60535.1 putative uncharacterized protein [Tetragenococcus halophilus subsp. halophilus]GBD71167.1 putative uncharacterized protein [Tetragenococcus halophilus subsp. halophilus]
MNAKDEIILGAGVIGNNYHKRKDLTPNVYALYVEENYWKQRLASIILNFIRQDFERSER